MRVNHNGTPNRLDEFSFSQQLGRPLTDEERHLLKLASMALDEGWDVKSTYEQLEKSREVMERSTQLLERSSLELIRSRNQRHDRTNGWRVFSNN